MKRGMSTLTSSGKSRKTPKRRKSVDSIELDDMDISDLGSEDQVLDAELMDEFESDELSEIQDFMDPDDTVDVVSDLLERDSEESRGAQELISHSEHKPRRTTTSRTKEARKDMAEDDSDEMWKLEQKPRARWFMTTCPYCGDIYRFRSDQPQPFTCGNPQCVERFEERMKRKAAAVT